MPITIQYLQNTGNTNGYATVDFPTAGASVVSMPYSGAPAQQWIAAQYPGTDPTNSDGPVFVLYYGGNAASQLVLTAAVCQQFVTLQPFQPYNLSQLWSYAGSGSRLVNLATGCVLDDNGSGTIQTWPFVNNSNQPWTLLSEGDAARVACEAEEALVAAG